MNTVTGVLLLAGSSTRYNKGLNKNLDRIDDNLVIKYSLDIFVNNKYIDNIILVIREEDLDELIENVNLDCKKNIQLVKGGKTRQESVYNALQLVDSDIVIIHDGARPLIKDEYINKCIETMDNYDACTIAVKAKDTIKISNNRGEVVNTTNRDNTWLVQTPQCFKTDILYEAHRKYKGMVMTDDCLLVEKEGIKVKLIEGDYSNIKITTPEDIRLVKILSK